MFLDTVQRRVQARLEALAFDFSAYSLDALIKHLEQRRGRRIRLIGLALPPGEYGCWLTSADLPLEFIFFSSSLSPLQREHTLLHELGHLIFEHPTRAVSQAELERWRRSGELPAGLFRTDETAYDRQELEAETLAVLVQALVHRYNPTPPTSSLEVGQAYQSQVWRWG